MNKNKISIIIGVIIFFILIFEIIFYIKNGIQINKLNNMYKDIEVLEDKISLYYLNNTELPIYDDVIINFEYSINPNDNNVYYEIDLKKFESLNLSYGRKQNNVNDKYIINQQSHTIYYYQGIEYNEKIYYTKNINYQNVELEKF